MHTFSHAGVHVHHNGEFSGEAVVVVPITDDTPLPHEEVLSDGTRVYMARIPAAALVALSRSATLGDVISAVEGLM